MIDPVAGGTAAVAAGTAATKTVSQAEFLQLFVAQLQHQDPLSPMEPNELTAQLAQFSSLEQLTGINSRLDTLTGSARQTSGSVLLGLIGKEITFDGSRLAAVGGKAPDVSYTLSQSAAKVTATVRDAAGNVVRVVDLGAQNTGEHTFHFDGKTDTGATIPDGTYALEITAGTKTPTPLDLTAKATVDGVDLASDPQALLVGNLRVGIDQVREVHSAGTAP